MLWSTPDSCARVAAEIGKDSLSIIEVQPIERLRELAERAKSLRADFQPAQIAQGGKCSDIRGDLTRWLEFEDPLETQLLGSLTELRTALNRQLLLGLNEIEGHYSLYPKGAHYKRHLDRPRGNDRRALSMVLYLNADWRDEWGGELVLFTVAGERSVSPRLGTVVLFLSDVLEHEVRPSSVDRLGAAFWFLRGQRL
ncbi:MAG: 2OG-Fe(II) oxygenase [Deltaproteobacteria bacterium]|nr:2OG-Fe(II) oxygenase [Deltaproteobacteria bacterium]MBI3294643.1 2OG-Fe(II) oxygenase [Deltaproteobacteria bacterium]